MSVPLKPEAPPEHDTPEGPCACGAWHRPVSVGAASEGKSPVRELAALIREIDGNHSLGAGELAERLIARGVRPSSDSPTLREALELAVPILGALRGMWPKPMDTDVAAAYEAGRAALSPSPPQEKP